MVDAACIICFGTLTSQFVIVKSNITFIWGNGPLERSRGKSRRTSGKIQESGLDNKTQHLLHFYYNTPDFSFNSYEGPKRWSLASPLSNKGNGTELVYVTCPRLVVEPDLSPCCLTLISCSTIISNASH